MLRRCAVFGCDNTTYDSGSANYKQQPNLHSFAFPLDKSLALKWKESLELREFPLELLQLKFVVCSEHFRDEDLEEHGVEGVTLKPEAIPKLQSLCDNTRSMGTRGGGFHDTEEQGQMPLSFHSTASTNNTDICILEANESHYGGVGYYRAERNIADFTMLHVPVQPQYHQYGGIEESTEVLQIPLNDYDNDGSRQRRQNQTFSGTDSDVEILNSEEVNEADDKEALEEEENTTNSIKSISLTDYTKSHHESVDQDLSIEEFSSATNHENLSKPQLLIVIKEQTLRIRQLESLLERYRRAQQKLYDQVDAMREEFNQVAKINH